MPSENDSSDDRPRKSLTVGSVEGTSSRSSRKRTTLLEQAVAGRGKGLIEILEQVKRTEAYRKLKTGQDQALTIDEVTELFAKFAHDEIGAVDAEQLQLVLEEAIPDSWIINCLSRLSPVDAETNRMRPDDFWHVVRLGSPETVKTMSLRLHGMNGKTFVLRENLVDFLLKRKVQHENCRAMPITIVFFCVVFYMVVSHLSIPVMQELNMAVSFGLKSGDIAEAFPDTFWEHFEQYAGPYVAHRNLIVGGVRVSRIAEEGKPNGPLCDYSPWNYLWDEIRTAGKVSDEPHPLEVVNKVTTPSAWLHWQLFPDDALLRFNTGETPQSLCQRLQEKNCSMASAPKSSGATLRPDWYLSGGRRGTLQLELITFNEKLRFYVFNRIQVTVLHSGAVDVSDLVESFADHPVWLNFDDDVSQGRLAVVVIDIVFFLLFLFNVINLSYNIVRTLRYGHLKILLADIWVKVEILNIFLVFMIILGYFHCVHLVRGLNQLKADLPFPDKTKYGFYLQYSVPQWENFIGTPLSLYEGQVHGVIDQASRVAQSYKDLRWYVALFCFGSCMRFFKVFQANERLNVVFKTVVRAGADLLHFLIVFLSLVMAFVLVAHVLFGSQMDSFESLGEATNSCFLFLLGYLFDDVWADMVENGGSLAIIWSVLFMIFMVLLSLNMVLAIIFDVYGDVKAAAINEPSLLEQIANFWKAGKKKSDTTGSNDPAAEDEEFSNIARHGSTTSVTSEGIKDRISALVHGMEQGVHVAYEEAEHAAHEIAEAFLEDHLLDALTVRDLHPDDLVTTETLMDALGYRGTSTYSKLEEIILLAAENTEFETQVTEFNYTSKLRLIQRIDQNMRDLGKTGKLKAQKNQGVTSEMHLPNAQYVPQANQVATTFQMLEEECTLLVNAEQWGQNKEKVADEIVARAEAVAAQAQAGVAKARKDAQSILNEKAVAQGALPPPLPPTGYNLPPKPAAKAHPATTEKQIAAPPPPRPPPKAAEEASQSQAQGAQPGAKAKAGNTSETRQKTKSALLGGLRSGSLHKAVDKMEEDLAQEETVAAAKTEAAQPTTIEEEIAARNRAVEEALQAQEKAVATAKAETQAARPPSIEEEMAARARAVEEASQVQAQGVAVAKTEAAQPATIEDEIAARTRAMEEASQAQAPAAKKKEARRSSSKAADEIAARALTKSLEEDTGGQPEAKAKAGNTSETRQKTKSALLGGLRSGALHKAVDKMEEDLAQEEAVAAPKAAEKNAAGRESSTTAEKKEARRSSSKAADDIAARALTKSLEEDTWVEV